MTEIVRDVVIVGAGTAGLHAYKTATARGARALLIERGPGGSTCTRDGCMPSKALLAAANAAHAARGAGRFGIGAGAVTVDGPAVMARVRAERDHFDGAIRDQYHGYPAEDRLHGEARFLAPDRLAVGNDVVVATRAVVIATGSRPTVPAAFDAIAALVHTNETIFEIADLPAALGVIGAGALGLELAQAFARLGVAVTLLDQGDVVANLDDPEAAAAARDALGSEMTIHLGVEVEAEMAGGRARLRWTGASRGEAEVDLVLVAAGRVPNVDDLGLDVAGLPLDDDGVPLFDQATRRVGEADVYIAGDAGGWRPVLHEAARGGRIAGDDAAGGGPWPPIPALSIAFTEPNIAQVGARFADLPDGARIGTARVADNGRARIEGYGAGVVRLYGDAGGRVIGGTLVAHGAEHLAQALGIAITAGFRADRLCDLAWYHPTIEELLQAAARDLAGEGPDAD